VWASTIAFLCTATTAVFSPGWNQDPQQTVMPTEVAGHLMGETVDASWKRDLTCLNCRSHNSDRIPMSLLERCPVCRNCEGAPHYALSGLTGL
jgi:hypothetical protein